MGMSRVNWRGCFVGRVCVPQLTVISSAITKRSAYKRDNDIAVGVQTATRLIEQSIGSTAKGGEHEVRLREVDLHHLTRPELWGSRRRSTNFISPSHRQRRRDG